jgi:hypothetical protein
MNDPHHRRRRNRRHYQQYTRGLNGEHPPKMAVDGIEETGLANCTVLDNSASQEPMWMVDLGKRKSVQGIVLLTWQGAGKGVFSISI